MTPRATSPPPALLDREEELAAIETALEQGGRAGVAVALTGEPGIGKTALLAAARASAVDRGRLVLSCSGFEVETHMPFAALYELLAPVLHHTDTLAAPERDALLGAFGMTEGTQPEPFLIAAAVQGALTAAARHRPVAVLIDDAQWLDPPSGDCLALVARRVGAESAPVCVIATVRLDVPDRIPAFLTAIDRRVAVGGLSETGATMLLRRAAPGLSGPERRRVQHQARGNPLALIELPATSHGDEVDIEFPALSDRLARDFGGRCAELPPVTRDALLVAAVNDRPDVEETLAAASILAQRHVEHTDLAAARDAGLLLIEADHFSFRHPLVRSGIVQTERLSRRQDAHAALARVVTTPYRQAWHRAQAIVGPDDDIADKLEETVEASLRQGAVLAAINSLERAAELTVSPTRRGRRLLTAAEHAFGLGRTQLVHRLVTEASSGELDELDRARVQWLREIFNDGVPGDAARVQELCQVAAQSAAADNLDLALNLLLGAALRCWWADTGPDARARVVTSVTALDVGNDPRAVAATAVAEPVLQAAATTAALASMPVSAVTEADGLRLLGLAAHAIGDSVRADDYLTAAEARLRVQQRVGVLAHALSMHVIVLLELGDWDRAAVVSSEAMALADETGQPIWTAGSMVCEAIGLALRGDAAAALDMVARVELIAHRSRLNDLLSCAALAQGIALLTLERNDEAFDTLRQLFDPGNPYYHQREGFGGLMFLAEAAARSGRYEEARTILDILEATATITPAPVLHLHRNYARAVLAHRATSERHFRSALATLELPRWPWVQARTQLAFGTWLGQQHRTAEAGGLLAAALATFERIGARHWARQAHDALHAFDE